MRHTLAVEEIPHRTAQGILGGIIVGWRNCIASYLLPLNASGHAVLVVIEEFFHFHMPPGISNH